MPAVKISLTSNMCKDNLGNEYCSFVRCFSWATRWFQKVTGSHFSCDLSQCKGACCVEGEAGAPLDQTEVDRLAKDYEAISPYLDPAGRAAMAAQGTSIVAKDQSLETPLVEGKACAMLLLTSRVGRIVVSSKPIKLVLWIGKNQFLVICILCV